jgi:hypothetical protein
MVIVGHVVALTTRFDSVLQHRPPLFRLALRDTTTSFHIGSHIHTASCRVRTLQLDLSLDLLGRPLRFSGMNNGLRLNLTERMDLTLIHGHEPIAPSLSGGHYGLSLGGRLYHGLCLCLNHQISKIDR